MELASRIRWILVLVVGILFLFLIGWGLYSIASNMFNGDSSETSTTEPTYNVTTAATAKFTNDGPVVASDLHRSYTIEVSQNVVMMKVYKNYGQTVITEKSYSNNPESFITFLNSLENLDVTSRLRGTTAEDDNADKGVCPQGQRFILEIDSNLRRWATTCSTREGNAGFDMLAVKNLFDRQVPDFDELIMGTGL